MANCYYDATGVLCLKTLTPVIKALFGPFNLDESSPGGEVYIANIAEDSNTSWDAVLENLTDLAAELKLTPPEDAEGSIEEYLHLLAKHFGADQDEALGNLIEHHDFDNDADLEELFIIAQRFNDGHGLHAIKYEGCWHCSKPRLFEFGGHGSFIGTHCRLNQSSTHAVTLGAELEDALEAGDLDKSAELILTEIDRLLNGLSKEDVREALRVKVSRQLIRT